MGLCDQFETTQQRSEAIIFNFAYCTLDQLGSYLVRCRIFTEANVSMDSKNDVFDGKLRNRFIGCYNGFGRALNKGVPVLQSATILSIMRYTCQ